MTITHYAHTVTAAAVFAMSRKDRPLHTFTHISMKGQVINMILKQKELDVISELQTQEKSCVEKYQRYKEQAKDVELKNLFDQLAHSEQEHYNSLGKVLNGEVPECNCNDSSGKDYQPTATYSTLNETEDKKSDNFLVTDCIGTEKMVSSEYNSDVFRFGEPSVRKLLADIQIEEQNHAEMLYKYKTTNGMA